MTNTYWILGISGVIALVFTFWFSAFLTVWADIKVAKQLFNTLGSRKYYANYDHVYSHSFGEPDDGFIWFTTTREFQLSHNHYLHNANFMYHSIWGWYWLNKYQRWFEENINVATLPKYTSKK